MSEQVFLYAGGGGGKSSFIGGLLQHLYDEPETTVTYEVNPGDVWTFENTVIGPMMESNEYPEPTTHPYVASLSITSNSIHKSNSTISIVDAPGEWFGEHLLSPSQRQQQDIEEVPDDPSIEDGDDDTDVEMSDAEGAQFLRQQYATSERVIFLLNLPQLVNEDNTESLVFDLSSIERVSNEKECAIVALGTDEIEYDPDTVEHDENEWVQFAKETVGLSDGQYVDTQLIEAVEQAVPRAGNLQVHNITNGVKSGMDVDFFGVALPADNGGIQGGDDGCMTQGFRQVVDWLVPNKSPISELPIGRGE